MLTEVKLPELGEGVENGDVLDVFVTEGDVVKKDQPILELETDKASVEVPSKVEGKVVKVHVQKGQTIAIGSVILTVDTGSSDDSSSSAATASPAAEPATETPVSPPPPASSPSAETSSETPPPPAPEPVAPPPAPAAPAPAAPASESVPPTGAATPPPASSDPATLDAAFAATSSSSHVAPAGPAIRRLAREVGVDLSTVQGTGPGGRITREDIMRVVREGHRAPTSPNQSSTPDATAPQSTSSPPADSSVTPEPSDTTDQWGPIHIEPMSKIRKTISSKMHESWSTVPRVTNFDDADITELESIRQASKKDYAARGIKLTQMPFLIKAVAMALKTNPTINASIDTEQQQIIYKKYVNIGIAVDTERGLVVPALRNVDQMSIPETARALTTLSENVRSNNFKLEDLRGSTFTISNLGAIGGSYSTPIVNVPEVAILLVGRSRKMPVVIDDEIKIRLMMPLSLSYDHRLVDGATAARFLNDVISYLETPSRLLIAP